MLRAFFEPAISFTGLAYRDVGEYPAQHIAWQLAELACLSCFCVDIYTKFTYMTRNVYWAKPWHKQYLAVVVLLTLDGLLGAGLGQRPFRFLRPMLIFYRNREQRRILTSLLHLISHQLGVALVSTMACVAFAVSVFRCVAQHWTLPFVDLGHGLRKRGDFAFSGTFVFHQKTCLGLLCACYAIVSFRRCGHPR